MQFGSLSRIRMSRFLTDERAPSAQLPPLNLTDFFLEEFLKHQQCLREQRESFSERAISEVETALRRVMAELPDLCRQQNAGEVVSQLLRKFDLLTGLSGWSDPKNLH
jgi:hypothetical protein